MKKIKIRIAVRTDLKSVLKLIRELADFEKLTPPDKKAYRRLEKDAFSKNQKIKILLAETEGEVLGYAIYFFTYSSFMARKTLYLEDIFISAEYRNKGIGKLFFEKLLKIAVKQKCGRIEWVVLDWNENAIKFYEKLGAKHLKEWKIFRMDL